ncbi:MAG: nucleotidyltransferase family protein [Acetobacter aceti]|uniref:Molybdopterin biosynthesis enzyme n=1 Tax=Acetobacter aceti TaxID=435 RepID=A0A1U9KF69_ACEAC|nr:nucleotidyltransferase family protein [Acetobacter aceti]AQS84426.1 molybdopterin biosynthesis enzyme [Acetobacter aceti]
MMESAPVVAVVLAAGRSSRSGGQHKLLARDADGRTMLARTLAGLCASQVSALCVVLPPLARDVTDALQAVVRESGCGKQIDIRISTAADEGLAASLKVGVAWAEEQQATGCLVSLGDMPLVGSGVIDALIGCFLAGNADVVLPEWQGRVGNPVLWRAGCFASLMALAGDRGGKALLSDPSLVKARVLGAPSILVDFDTHASLQKFAQMRAAETS